jgi:hypothetical protein
MRVFSTLSFRASGPPKLVKNFKDAPSPVAQVVGLCGLCLFGDASFFDLVFVRVHEFF